MTECHFEHVKNKYIYHYTDHLGNVRLSYAGNGSGIEVIEENNYYPFGLKHEGYNNLGGNPAYQYKYNGKELQETGMYDYGARMYMPDIGRWGVVDPLAETSRRWSPYNYAYNNPIRFIDPDGRQVKDIYELNKKGELIWRAASERDVIYASKNFDGNGNLKAENDGGVDVGEGGYIAENSLSANVKIKQFNKDVEKKYDYIKFGANTGGAKKVFDYITKNTEVEFNRNIFVNNKNDQFSFVGTIYEESQVPIVELGARLIESEHGHHDPITFWPSGFNVTYSDKTGKFKSTHGLPTGDIEAAKAYPKAKFLLYAPNYKNGPLRIQYDEKEIISITNERN